VNKLSFLLLLFFYKAPALPSAVEAHLAVSSLMVCSGDQARTLHAAIPSWERGQSEASCAKAHRNIVPRRPMGVHTSGMGISNKGPTFVPSPSWEPGNISCVCKPAALNQPRRRRRPRRSRGESREGIAVRPGADDDMDLSNFFKR